jgi:hypothetical protein
LALHYAQCSNAFGDQEFKHLAVLDVQEKTPQFKRCAAVFESRAASIEHRTKGSDI